MAIVGAIARGRDRTLFIATNGDRAAGVEPPGCKHHHREQEKGGSNRMQVFAFQDLQDFG